MSETKRVFVCGIEQESNSFNPIFMPLDKFHCQSADKSNYGKGAGAYKVFNENGIECVYGTHMTANSSAPVKNEVVNYFLDNTLSQISAAGRLDGVFLLLHGATMSESIDDVCGHICEKIREAVGEEIPIAASFDLHANITEKMMENVDYVSGYWEYPHIDQLRTGLRCATLLCQHLNGNKLFMARAALPLMAPAHAYTTVRGALKKLNEKAQAMVAEGKIEDYTLFQVQPWLDAPYVESCVIVVAKDEKTAKDVANELAKNIFDSKEELQGTPLFTPAEVIEKALANKSGKPVILVDSADSVGAGSTGDSAQVLEELLPFADKIRAAVAFVDAPATEKAFALGVGNTAVFTLGATVSPKLSKPITVEAKVRSLHSGSYLRRGPIFKGGPVSFGKTAVLEIGKILVRISNLPGVGGDRNHYEACGIIVDELDLVSVKACTSFRAGYEDFAAEICNTGTAGAACPVLSQLPYERLPKPTYPFEKISESDIKPAKIYR